MRFLKPGRLIIYLILIVIARNNIAGSIALPEKITIKEGQSVLQALTPHLGWFTEQRLKRAFRGNDALTAIQPGQYTFSGSLTPDEIISILSQGPTSAYQRTTILEGWNSRDVDAYLTKEFGLPAGTYRSFITDQTIISKYAAKYPFLAKVIEERGSLASLEGYLYPETYMLDSSKDIIDQLVYLQLETFEERVWSKYGEQLSSLGSLLQQKGYTFPLSSYGALILASIIEKEEAVDANKPLIASIFFNRLEQGMRLDADISLCYGFQEPYETCTPARIRQHLDEKANPYNTRANKGLPPTPISTIHVSSLQALLDAPKTNYLFYLHNKDGKLFPAETNDQHNLNKSKEL